MQLICTKWHENQMISFNVILFISQHSLLFEPLPLVTTNVIFKLFFFYRQTKPFDKVVACSVFFASHTGWTIFSRFFGLVEISFVYFDSTLMYTIKTIWKDDWRRQVDLYRISLGRAAPTRWFCLNKFLSFRPKPNDFSSVVILLYLH